MTTMTGPSSDPATDLRLARLHLRMGQLGLARAALEALAGSGDLDTDGLLALAEARWRTGDLSGAGEAAQVYRDRAGESVVALVIAAESVAAVGRPAEARRIAATALEQADAPLDGIFAGMPRSSIWPADSAAGAEPAATLFGADAAARRALASPSGASPAAPGTRDERTGPSSSRPGVWDALVDEPGPLPDAASTLDEARASLSEGRVEEAILRLAIVLRADPDLAPAVLEATEAAERTPAVEIVRGDAFGLAGQEFEARRAYAAAAARLSAPPDGGTQRRGDAAGTRSATGARQAPKQEKA